MTYAILVVMLMGFGYIGWKLHRLEKRLAANEAGQKTNNEQIVQVNQRVVATNQLFGNLDTKIDKTNKKVGEIDKRTTPGAMTKEQLDFKEDLEKRWKTTMEKARTDLAEQLVLDKDKLKADVEKYKAGFEATVKKAYDEACAKIDFERVEYKKTITKKRREFSRSHKAVTPQRSFRSIDDE
jgi:hypothetical protein